MKKLLVALLWGLLCASVHSATINVPADQPTIQSGIDVSFDFDTVVVDDGVYSGDGNRDMSFQGRKIVVTSANGPDACIIDLQDSGDPLGHYAFDFNSGEDSTSVLQGFTIQNGHPHYSLAGGITCMESSPVLRQIKFVDNYPRAIEVVWGSPRIEECTFRGNNAGGSDGGAIKAVLADLMEVIDCQFVDNSSEYGEGGAMALSSSSVAIIGCDFVGDTSGWRGGAIRAAHCSLYVRDCYFKDNVSYWAGGAMLVDRSQLVVEGCIFEDNHCSDGPGGAIQVGTGTNTIRSCTFSGNHAWAGGAIGIGGQTLSVENCIIVNGLRGAGIGNGQSDWVDVSCTDVYNNVGGDWVGCIADQANINGNMSLDPLFCGPDSGNFWLHNTSPCLPTNNDCGELIGALGMGCYDPKVLVEPDPMFIAFLYAVDTVWATANLGQFADGHDVHDIEATSVLVNNSSIPCSTWIEGSLPNFVGEVFRAKFDAKPFIASYGVVFDTTVQNFFVSSYFSDRDTLHLDGSFRLVGHLSGDMNLDGNVNITDLTYFVAYLFGGGPPPLIMESADLNRDGSINIADLTYLVAYLFGGGASPAACP